MGGHDCRAWQQQRAARALIGAGRTCVSSARSGSAATTSPSSAACSRARPLLLPQEKRYLKATCGVALSTIMFLTKTDIKQLFRISAKHRLPDADHAAMACFVRNTIIGCGSECKWIGDVREFDAMYRLDWSKLWARHSGKLPDVREWAVVGEEPGTVLFIVHGKNERGWPIEVSCEKMPLPDWQR
jgi:hypothetical protein